ncbi:MAG: hypothetical protein PHV68_08180 [Candidatus Gastranaerophilales bacterium]|nr:hypothetical protein [Candidatus Gastranaerophilales bacterium]
MIEEYIKKYKIKKKRIPQVKELFRITKDPRLSTFIVNSTKSEPELIDFLLNNYKNASTRSKFKDPGAIIYTMFQTIKIDYISHKREKGHRITKQELDYFIEHGTKIITLLNSVGETLVIEVVKDDRGTFFVYQDTVPPYPQK